MSRGGGVLIAVKHNLPSHVIVKHKSIELISVELDLSPKLLIICLYIPPMCCDEYQREVSRSINSLPATCDTIILGDFNCPDINWSTLNASTPFSSSLCNQLYSLNYVQLVTEPTHIHGNTLDLILTNSPHRLQNIDVSTSSTDSLFVSDHHVVTFDVQWNL